MDFLVFTISVVAIFIWMETDAFVEYCLKLRIPIQSVKEFWEFKKTSPIFYPDFLILKNNCFTTRLLSCNYCLNVILTSIFYLIFASKFDLRVLAANIVLGWIVYAILIKKIKEV